MIFCLFVYVFFRTESTIINEIIQNILGADFLILLKQNISKSIHLNRHLIYSVPEGLWVFCVCLISKGLYFKIKDTKINCAYLSLIYPIALEFLQKNKITNGTFDVYDILFSIFFWLIAYLFISSPYEEKNIFEKYSFRTVCSVFGYLIVYLSDVLETF